MIKQLFNEENPAKLRRVFLYAPSLSPYKMNNSGDMEPNPLVSPDHERIAIVRGENGQEERLMYTATVAVPFDAPDEEAIKLHGGRECSIVWQGLEEDAIYYGDKKHVLASDKNLAL